MIIVLTNRSLPVVPNQNTIDVNVNNLGVNLGAKIDNNDRVFAGEFAPDVDGKPQYNKLTFHPKGSESDVFDKINPNNDGLAAPWVFFVHGFHQDPTEAIGKARALQDNHKVNVVLFTWPSRPLDKTYKLDEAKQAVIQDLFNGTLGKGTLFKIGKDLLLGYLKDTWHNYPPAIENAEKSKVDLLAALNLFNKNLLNKENIAPPVLLIHSMGNYLLENTMKDIDKLPMNFNNIVLHQADVTVPDYDWVNKLSKNLKSENGARLYITTNYDDYVLLSSKARRAILKKQGELPSSASTERLGRYIENIESGDFHYIDFSEGENVNDEHEFFKLSRELTNPHIHELLGKLFRADYDDVLPENQRASLNGFSKMPIDTNLYRLEYVIHPADIADDTRIEDRVLVRSLDMFDQNKGPNDYDPDLDDE